MRKLAMLVLALMLSGCASTVPLQVACTACAQLDALHLCELADKVASSRGLPTCPDGLRYEVLNPQAWLDGEEAPRVECRSYSIK